MSDDEGDLFASDSDDTADLIAASKKPSSSAAAAAASAKKKATAADSDDDKGLFDSDDDDSKEERSPKKKKAAVTLSKRERLEALSNKRHRKEEPKSKRTGSSGDKTSSGDNKDKETGYDSEDTYDSATFQRTADDDAFIDTTGEDADAVNELYAAQNFRDERPDEEDDEGGRGKKKSKKRRQNDDETEPDNPVMAAVHRMKKKKREKKSLTELDDEVKVFLNDMDMAAEDDEQLVAKRLPATNKLKMLEKVLHMMARRDLQRKLLDFDLLTVVKRWVQPLPNGTLGNVTVRQRLLEAVSKMNAGETGINSNDLKRSELGKTVMTLFKHRDETPAMKRQLKTLVEQWSRPIFAKSGNMRDLERVHGHRGTEGLAAVAARQNAAVRQQDASGSRHKRAAQQDVQSLIAVGKKGGAEAVLNRVRVPFSKGFSYSVRPAGRAADAGSPDGKRSNKDGASDVTLNKRALNKRMLEKGRAKGKNQRSANVSVEGRVSKG